MLVQLSKTLGLFLASAQIVALFFALAPADSSAVPTCPEPPYDVQACGMSNGCPGVSYCTGLGRWSACQCFASGGEQVSCAGTTTTNGCSIKYAGTGTCTSSCTNDCDQNKVWVKTSANFTGAGSGGYGAFSVAECGSKEAGTCPFKDPNNLANYGQQIQWKGVTSSAKNTGAGCADGDANCRFSASATQPQVTFKVKGADDYNGPRNELAAFKEDCGSKYNAGEGEVRWYNLEVLVPSAEFPNPGTFDPSVSGPLGTVFMQFMHDQIPWANDCPGPYSFLGIRRTDTSTHQYRGDLWQFVYEDRNGIIDGSSAPWISPSTRHWPAATNTTGLSKDVWHKFLVKKVWSATNGETHVWHNEVKVVTLTGQKTLPTYPSNASHACYNSGQAGQTMGVFQKLGQYTNPTQNALYALQFRDVAVAPTCAEACPKCLATTCP